MTAAESWAAATVLRRTELFVILFFEKAVFDHPPLKNH